MTARRLLILLLPLTLFATVAQAHPGHDPEGLHRLVHALADLDPRAAILGIAAAVALVLARRHRATVRDLMQARRSGGH